MSDELPNCPFCGSRASSTSDGVLAYCTGCDASAPVEDWRRRTPGPQTRRVIKRMEAYSKAISFAPCIPFPPEEILNFLAEQTGKE